MPKTMLEKLTEDYKRTQEWDNGGHAICYDIEVDELIKGSYEFPNGKYTIRSIYGKFIWWNYDPIKKK